jgi:hypothetical protein
MSFEAIVSTVSWTSPASTELVRQKDSAPPGVSVPLFLQIHSLLI